MKIAVLSDAHGNDVYFDKCMCDIQKHKPDQVIFLGDCFGYMRDGNAILSKLRQMNARILLGNHEAMLMGLLPYHPEKEEIYGLKADRENISDSNLAYISGLLSEYDIEIDGKKALFVHGCPDNSLNGYLYEDDGAYHWEQCSYDYVFMGHTHHPYIKKCSHTVYVNVGSCGLPRDNGTAPSYDIFDTQTGKAVIYRIEITKNELEKVTINNIHSSVYECFMRKGNKVCRQLM